MAVQMMSDIIDKCVHKHIIKTVNTLITYSM